jgi:hypothetical protein
MHGRAGAIEKGEKDTGKWQLWNYLLTPLLQKSLLGKQSISKITIFKIWMCDQDHVYHEMIYHIIEAVTEEIDRERQRESIKVYRVGRLNPQKVSNF